MKKIVGLYNWLPVSKNYKIMFKFQELVHDAQIVYHYDGKSLYIRSHTEQVKSHIFIII